MAWTTPCAESTRFHNPPFCFGWGVALLHTRHIVLCVQQAWRTFLVLYHSYLSENNNHVHVDSPFLPINSLATYCAVLDQHYLSSPPTLVDRFSCIPLALQPRFQLRTKCKWYTHCRPPSSRYHVLRSLKHPQSIYTIILTHSRIRQPLHTISVSSSCHQQLILNKSS